VGENEMAISQQLSAKLLVGAYGRKRTWQRVLIADNHNLVAEMCKKLMSNAVKPLILNSSRGQVKGPANLSRKNANNWT
jgi:hypothetical protein